MTAARQPVRKSCAAAQARHRMWPQGTSAVDTAGLDADGLLSGRSPPEPGCPVLHQFDALADPARVAA